MTRQADPLTEINRPVRAQALPGNLRDGTNKLYGLRERLLDLLFPPRCVSCRQPGSAFCVTCLASIQLVPPPTCMRCGQPLHSSSDACEYCRTRSLVITRIISTAWHEGVLREAIHALKYNRRRDVARPLAQLMSRHLKTLDLVFDVVTYVPLHPARELERGYNQAELLAAHTANLTRAPFAHTLERTRATADQIGLDAKARRANVRDAFKARPYPLRQKRVLLVDDVTTTGATFEACATALFECGARSVYGMTVARPRPST